MSKPMVVTLPVVMILLDYWPLKRFESQKGNVILWQLKEKIPFFILVSSFFNYHALRSIQADRQNITPCLSIPESPMRLFLL